MQLSGVPAGRPVVGAQESVGAAVAEDHGAAEIAELTVFLLSPAARFFCGSVIFCDGGTDALLRPGDWPARWDAHEAVDQDRANR